MIASLTNRTEDVSTTAAHADPAISLQPTRSSTVPAAPTDQAARILPPEQVRWSPERSVELCGDRLAASSLPPPPPPSREDATAPLGRRTLEKAGVDPFLHPSCFGSDGDGGETKTGAVGLSNKCSEVDCQRPTCTGKAESDHFHGGEPPSRGAGECYQRQQHVGGDPIPELKQPTHAGHHPRRGLVNSVSSEVRRVLESLYSHLAATLQATALYLMTISATIVQV